MVDDRKMQTFFKILFLRKLSHKELLHLLITQVEKYYICVFWSLSVNVSGYVTGELFLVSVILRSL